MMHSKGSSMHGPTIACTTEKPPPRSRNEKILKKK